MAAPELQPLALEAKSDAAILKYLPLPAQQVGGVVDTLSQAAAAELWPTRAAALAFSQVPLSPFSPGMTFLWGMSLLECQAHLSNPFPESGSIPSSIRAVVMHSLAVVNH